jgi:hypothetical protein
MRKSSSVLAIVVAGALVAAAPTGAARVAATTFDGSCEIAVTVSFDPPLTNAPQSIDQTARGTGSCTGTLTDRAGRSHELDSAPIGYYSFSRAENSSCLEGLNSGSGALTFRYGKLRFAFTERRAGPFPTLEYNGLVGGSAFGAGHPASDADPVAAVQACGAGGLKSFGVEGQLQTTPSISG